ncbi:hypothetical protein ACT3SP_01770 [Brachybacterium sp. AOP43-C2-M15]|uniref:hypothetical protein n=1 Tax=Brachybacterium sp. AOP43-C2-M15 TaxID=3457661 RepID=UPI0040336B11
MNSNPEQDALRSRWTLEGRIPLSGVADGAEWRRARSVTTGELVVLFIVRGEAALEAADAVRRAYLVEHPHLLPVQEIVVLDDPRETAEDTADAAGSRGATTVVEYPMPPAPPLAALLTKGPLHPETARSIIGEAARGLEAARRRGVRHQFLDSNRLFVDTRSGSVSILGIGVEAAAHAGLDRSREAASFQDTAALVALLYRALTGRSPQHDAAGTVPRPSSVVDTEIPQDLDLLCDLVLNESGEDIPETTRGLIEALEPWQSIPVTLEAYPRSSSRSDEEADGTSAAEEPTAVIERAEAEEPSLSAPTEEERAAEPAADAASSAGEPAEQDTIAAAPPAAGIGTAGAAGAAGLVATAGQEEYAYGTAGEKALAEGTRSEDDGDLSPQDEGAQDADGQDADGHDEARRHAAEADARAAAEESRRASREAKALVDDLHLTEKRTSSAFPGHLEITGPDTAAQSSSSPSAAAGGAAAGGAAAGGAAAGGALAAGAAADAAGDDVPARTSGTHWPLSAEPEQGDAAALAPARSPQGSDGRATQPPEETSARSSAATPDHSAHTPSHPVTHSADSRSSEPVAVTGRTASLAPAQGDGPIVVHGRDRSVLEETPEESTVPAGRSSLLRDVVGVAVDTDAPETFTMGPRDQERRSLQSQWIIIGGAIVVMIALVIALTSITRDLRDIVTDPLATSQPPTSAAPTEEDTGEAPVEPTAEATEEELPPPEIAEAELFVQGSDNVDNADQLDRVTDGDPETYWSTQHYENPQYGGLKDGVGITLTFDEPTILKTVTVSTALNNGGRIELRALNDDGSLGDVLASGESVADGELRLDTPEPLETDKVALWIPELPPDSREDGRFRARIAEIQVE